MTQRWVVDSIEENIASVEVDGATMITVPVSLLPRAVHQGLILQVAHVAPPADGLTQLSITVDEAATREALAASVRQVAKGAKQSNDPGGNITF